MTQITWRVSESHASTNWDDWLTVCAKPNDVAMDPRFLEVVEESFAKEAEMMYLIGYQGEHPVACACISRFLVDGSVLAGPWHRKAINAVRKVFPRYLYFRILFCGLPVSIGCETLRMINSVDSGQIVESLAAEIDRLAEMRRSLVVVWKEFDDEQADTLAVLSQQGYLQADSLPMNTFNWGYHSLDEFCASLRSHYRYKIKKSRKKFAKSGLRVESITDSNRIVELYSPEVHELYLAVLDQAEHRLETLSREFFLNLVESMPSEISLTAVFRDERIVAFAWGVHVGDTYHNIFVGVDYSLNTSTDLYFNMMMCDLDFAMQSGARRIFVGQSADDFKSRLGCVQRPLSIFVKTRSAILNRLMALFAPLLFPPHKSAPPRDLFRSEEPAAETGTPQ